MEKESYTSGKIDWFQLEDLRDSEQNIGQIYPVLINIQGEIIDGFHRKRVNSAWKETKLQIAPGIPTLRLRVHLNLMRRGVERGEKEEWITETRQLLKREGKKGTQREIAEALGMQRQWVSKYDPEPDTYHKGQRLPRRSNLFYGYNVWGFEDESWRDLIIKGDSDQPNSESYHGNTPAFIIHQLIKMFTPQNALDTMAGIGTTKYVCDQYNIPCRQFDLYPFKGIEQGDAETINLTETYDLIFNHLPYLGMVKYGASVDDLSNMKAEQFYQKLGRIFQHNLNLLTDKGIYAVLVGDWRHGGHIEPITANTIRIAVDNGFWLQDCAIKLTGEMESKALQEYRAAKSGYLAQCYDTVLMFQKKG